MANQDEKIEKLKADYIAQQNEALGEQLSIASQLSTQMSLIAKYMKDKTDLDKLTVDLSKQNAKLARDLKLDIDDQASTQKQIAKVAEQQNKVSRIKKALLNEASNGLKQEIALHKYQTADLTKQLELGQITSEEYAKQMQTLEGQLSIEAKQIINLEKQEAVLKEILKTLAEQERRQNNINKAMGVLGRNSESIGKFFNKIGLSPIGKVFEAAGASARKAAMVVTDMGNKGAGAMGKLKVAVAAVGGALKALSAGGIIGIITMLYQKFVEYGEMGLNSLKRSSEQATQLSRNLGISSSKGQEVAASARSIGMAMGMTSDMAVNSAKEIYGAMQGTEKLTRNAQQAFMQLNVFAGMSADSLATFYKFSKQSGEEAGKLVKNMVATASQSIQSLKLNVSQKKLLTDVAAVSRNIQINFKGQGTEMVKVVAQAAKLGLNLSKVEKTMDSLLNFEDSISAEMEAQLLSGMDLNLAKAREFALANDYEGVMSEISKQGITQEKFAGMNRMAQEKVAQALGMSAEEMSDMLSGQKENVSENQQLIDLQTQGLAQMSSMVSVQERLLAMEQAREDALAGTGQGFLQMKELLNEIALKLMPYLNIIFEEVGALLNEMLGDVNEVTGGFELTGENAEEFRNTVRGVLDVFRTIKDIVGWIYDKFGAWGVILTPIVGKQLPSMVGSIGKYLFSQRKVLDDAGELVMKQSRFKDLVDGSGKLFSKLGGYIADGAKAMGGFIKKIAAGAYKMLAQAVSAIWGAFMMLGPIAGPIAAGVATAAIGALAYRYLSQGDDVVSPGYGKRTLYGPEGAIALNDKDTVIAGTKLFGDDVVSAPKGSVSVGGNDAMVAELRAMRAALDALVNQRGEVLLDGRKVGETLRLGSYATQ